MSENQNTYTFDVPTASNSTSSSATTGTTMNEPQNMPPQNRFEF